MYGNITDSGVSSRRKGLVPAVLILFLFILVFLLNRFDVPYAFKIDGWTLFPATLFVNLGMVALWLVTRVKVRAIVCPPRPSLWIPIVAWIATALFSTLTSDARESTNWQGLAALACIILWTSSLWIVPCLGLEKRSIYILLGIFSALACVGACLTTIQSLAPNSLRSILGWYQVRPESINVSRGVLPLGVSTVVGAFYMMTFPFGYSLVILSTEKWRRMAGFAVVFLMVTGCIFTASRTTVLAVFVTLLICILWMRRTRISSGIVLTIVAASVCLIGIALSTTDFSRLVDLQDASIKWRIRAIENAAEMFRDKPILGHGIESHFHRQKGTTSYSNIYSGIGGYEEIITYKNHHSGREPHNLFLLLASETGSVGLGFYLLFLFTLGRFFYNAIHSSVETRDTLLSKAFFIGFVAVMIHSLTGSDLLARQRLATLFWIYCGLGIAFNYSINNRRKVADEVEGDLRASCPHS